MRQLAGHQRTAMHFQRLVIDISSYAGSRLQFKQFRGMHWADDFPIDHEMGHPHLAFHLRMLRNDKHAWLFTIGNYIALAVAVDTQTALEMHIAFDVGRDAD